MTSWIPPNYRYRGAQTCWNVRPDPRLCLDPEEQVRERDGRLERVADHVRQQTVALEPARQRLRCPCSLGMDEDEDAELLGLGPERVKLRVAQLLLVDAPADGSPAQPVHLDS